MNRTVAEGHGAHDQIEERRFTGAIGAHDAKHLAVAEIEAEVVDRHQCTEGFGDLAGLQQRLTRHHARPAFSILNA